MSTYKIEIKDDKADVYTPFNRVFIAKLKQKIGGAKWSSNKKCWTVPQSAVSLVRQLMLDVYGENDLQKDNKITVQVETLEDIVEEQGPIILFGKCLCRAIGRDYVDRLSDDISYIKGKPLSGGSRQYWKSIIEKGCIINVGNVSVTLFEKEKNNSNYKFTIVDADGSSNVNKSELQIKIDRINKQIQRLERMKNIYLSQLNE